ncbi:MAG: UDP binding domain-containing protein, partial [Rudaea sp.]
QSGFAFRAYDPLVPPGSVVNQVGTLADAARGAAVILILTDHSEFKNLDPAAAPFQRDAVIVDTRNTLPAAAWREAGYTLVRLGEGEPC